MNYRMTYLLVKDLILQGVY